MLVGAGAGSGSGAGASTADAGAVNSFPVIWSVENPCFRDTLFTRYVPSVFFAILTIDENHGAAVFGPIHGRYGCHGRSLPAIDCRIDPAHAWASSMRWF